MQATLNIVLQRLVPGSEQTAAAAKITKDKLRTEKFKITTTGGVVEESLQAQKNLKMTPNEIMVPLCLLNIKSIPGYSLFCVSVTLEPMRIPWENWKNWLNQDESVISPWYLSSTFKVFLSPAKKRVEILFAPKDGFPADPEFWLTLRSAVVFFANLHRLKTAQLRIAKAVQSNNARNRKKYTQAFDKALESLIWDRIQTA